MAKSSKSIRLTSRERRETVTGLAFASPWIIGFLFFMFIPLIISFGMSFTNFSFLSEAKFVGLSNYAKMLFEDPLIWKSLGITFVYAIIAVPLQLAFGFVLALLLNTRIKGMPLFRTIFYMPTMVVAVSTSLIWKQMLDTDFGILNYLLSSVGLSKVRWLSSTSTILAALIFISLWSVGRSMVINLSGLQNIPTQLYEAAKIDGCSRFRQVFSITLPMMTPTIFLNLITGLIGAFKMFTTVQLLTEGGPNNASLFYMLYLYQNAFKNYRMGYASAMSWLLFIIVAILTVLVFRSSNSWVHYEGGVEE